MRIGAYPMRIVSDCVSDTGYGPKSAYPCFLVENAMSLFFGWGKRCVVLLSHVQTIWREIQLFFQSSLLLPHTHSLSFFLIPILILSLCAILQFCNSRSQKILRVKDERRRNLQRTPPANAIIGHWIAGVELEQMKERVSSLEGEVGGLMAQLSAYVPVVASLRENVASLQHNAVLRTKLLVESNQQYKDIEPQNYLRQKSCQDSREDRSILVPDGISELEKMQTMIKEVEKMFVEETERLAIEAVEKAMVEEMERIATQESTKNSNIKVEVSVEIEELKSEGTSLQGKGSKSEELKLVNEFTDENLKLQRMKSDNGTSMKDIPLDHVSDCSFYGRSGRDNGGADDQMLELWETAEQHCRQDPVTSEI
ncbi:PREDICTED: protein NETWORKED 1A-like [Prunus mume]|uniref:Protein NETWORKED 1A-like n=1 Tax=Prunus mume TaxID=102107 RepID=A0ABM0NG10_PRUMU|nr:PREDICTED: protein NETWORKED 1A-like [Prunus mume]